MTGHVITREGPYSWPSSLKLRTLASDRVITREGSQIQAVYCENADPRESQSKFRRGPSHELKTKSEIETLKPSSRNLVKLVNFRLTIQVLPCTFVDCHQK